MLDRTMFYHDYLYSQNSDFQLTQEQKDWFGDRMTEGATGAVRVPTYLIKKLKKMADMEDMPNDIAKNYLIDKCYNLTW